jgi:hypothetical protein
MRIRHRIPTIFNLSMVDVLCCALGCAILLWLLNLREAKLKAIKAGQTTEVLKTTEIELRQTRSVLASAAAERDDLGHRLETTSKERDNIRRDVEAAHVQVAALDEELSTIKTQKAATEKRLATAIRGQRVLSKDKAEAERLNAILESRLEDKDSLARAATARVDELAEQLRQSAAASKELNADLRAHRSKLVDAEARARLSQKEADERKKELAEVGQNIDTLQREKRALADQFNRARSAYENHFEGIALTGRRVIFLVDMSGSMELVDERTPDANKWSGVRETLAKIMRSLTELEKFQIIVFSDKIAYLLGNDGRWLDFDSKTSVDQAVRALGAIKPVGATNMYDAFEAAFRFRAVGLDTIYVLSDGLPNAGPGLTARQTRELKEVEQSEILAKYIRNLLRSDWNRPLSRQPRVRINTIGFFYESPDVGAFLWALARENDGSFVGMSKP